ncbi:MAG: AmmeMemoRadiSam system protein B [Thermodesulfobacteriota bacterium]
MTTRKPVFAGSWYPSSSAECERQIQAFLQETRFQTEIDGEYTAGIVPHAGWPFSGDLACRVISQLAGGPSSPNVVVVFGMHLPPDAPPHIMTEGWWDTPFGPIEIASELADKVTADHRFRIETARDFAPENTIELQLPFVKYFFPAARLLPVGPPAAESATHIGRSVVTHARALGLSLQIIGSTDLTHYGPNFGFQPAGTGRKAFEWVRDTNDRRVIDEMMAKKPEAVIKEALSNHNACCPGAAAAAITAAQELGAQKAGLVGYSSSYEKNPGDTFVGYAGIVYAR